MQTFRIFALICILISVASLLGCTASENRNVDKTDVAEPLLTPLKTPGNETGVQKENLSESAIYSIQFETTYPAVDKRISGIMEIDMGTREFCITNSRKEVVMCIYNDRHYLAVNADGNCSGTYAIYNDSALLDMKRCSLVSNAPVFGEQLYPFVFTLCENYANIVNKDDEAEYLRMRSDIEKNLSTGLNFSETELLLKYIGVNGLALPESLEWKEKNETWIRTTYSMTKKMNRLELLDEMMQKYDCRIEEATELFLEEE